MSSELSSKCTKMALITYSKVDYESFMYRQLKNTLIAEVTLIRIGS